MSNTTIRLPAELEARIAVAAERCGKTKESLILEAIAEKAELEERRLDFNDEADARLANIAISGETIGWTEMRSHLEARMAGKPLPAPKRAKVGG